MLSYSEIREHLRYQLSISNEIFLLSAFVKKNVVDWISQQAQAATRITLVSRFSCSDFLAGASDIDSIDLALSLGWTVKRFPSLHAKVFLFDKKTVIVGSANLTSNGLMISGRGNLEAAYQLEADSSDLNFVKDTVEYAENIDSEVLKKMREHIHGQELGLKQEKISEWPIGLFGVEKRIWVDDFFWLTHCDVPNEEDSSFQEIQQEFSQSGAFIWVKRKLLSSHDKSMSYGELTKALHDELCDDPRPYRSSVKELLSTAIDFCIAFPALGILVDRPNFSQILTLK